MSTRRVSRRNSAPAARQQRSPPRAPRQSRTSSKAVRARAPRASPIVRPVRARDPAPARRAPMPLAPAPRLASAPAALSAARMRSTVWSNDVAPFTSTYFEPLVRVEGDLTRSIHVKFRLPFSDVANLNTVLAGGPTGAITMYGTYTGTGTTCHASSVGFNPTRCPIISAGTTAGCRNLGTAIPSNKLLSTLANCFLQWRHTSPMTVVYRPALPDTTVVQYQAAWAGDAGNPVYGFTDAGNGCIQASDIDDTASSVIFGGSDYAQMVCPTDREWRYSFAGKPVMGVNQYPYTAGYFYPAPTIRSTTSGQLSIITTRLDTSVTFVTGKLYVEGEFEFRDPLPYAFMASLTASPLTFHLGGRGDGPDAEAKEEKLAPVPLTRSDEEDFTFEPYSGKNVHPPGMAIPVPGTADYRPSVASPVKTPSRK